MGRTELPPYAHFIEMPPMMRDPKMWEQVADLYRPNVLAQHARTPKFAGLSSVRQVRGSDKDVRYYEHPKVPPMHVTDMNPYLDTPTHLREAYQDPECHPDIKRAMRSKSARELTSCRGSRATEARNNGRMRTPSRYRSTSDRRTASGTSEISCSQYSSQCTSQSGWASSRSSRPSSSSRRNATPRAQGK